MSTSHERTSARLPREVNLRGATAGELLGLSPHHTRLAIDALLRSGGLGKETKLLSVRHLHGVKIDPSTTLETVIEAARIAFLEELQRLLNGNDIATEVTNEESGRALSFYTRVMLRSVILHDGDTFEVYARAVGWPEALWIALINTIARIFHA